MPAQCFEVPVLTRQSPAPDIRLLRVDWHGQPAPRPGQFFMLRGWAADELPFLSRPVSVHDCDGETVSFLFQVKGSGTQKLAALQPGDILRLVGPSGNGFDLAECRGRRVAVVGGGIGIAPLYYLCRALNDAGDTPDLYAGFRAQPYALARFKEVCKQVALATDDGCAGHHGLVTELIDPARYDIVLACGPAPMLRALAAKCKAAGTHCRVSLETRMACGIGACLGCTCHTEAGAKSVCQDGPVFDAQEVF